ncbi:hypothetical protein CgunFtcFv8_027762 [Champsocephalus gunnari]|uniref:Replication stress response regulator SDE2 n=1 Tax=Champsocephalus gunnari TaxID=52237 RepID=A0AAN8E829_CHAGU|nr:hypothetical protein CgunFtcFv8_027762 [Champsocephalus gunnari]
MEVIVSSPRFSFSSWVFPDGSPVREVLTRFLQQQGLSSSADFYVHSNGRLSELEDPLQAGAVYHLEPRLCGGKGGFGSMLRALGAQIEKTTNREACRDLSGRRLRDVNHEKEMAEWLKKQTEREAEKEQKRLDRLQRKLAEPRHQFTDPDYQKQSHELQERLEDSVMKGLQASSSTQVRADEGSAAKRPSGEKSEQPLRKKQKKAAFWTGLDEMMSSEEDEEDDEESPSSSLGASAVMMKPRRRVEQSSSSSDCSSSSTDQTSRKQGTSREPQGTKSQQVDLSSLSCVSQLEALGLARLKQELMSRGLKCGGTLSERAARLFSVRALRPEDVPAALLAKKKK